MIIEGKSAIITTDIQSVYSFLTNFNNYQKLMPEQITNWNSDENSCSFTIQGMADISLVFSESIPHSSIKLIPQGKVPFNFELTLELEENGGNTSAKVIVDASLNPMMAMMAKRPMENLVNVMAGNINDAIGR